MQQASITKDEILHTAKLARLRLSNNEETEFLGDLVKILSHFAQIQKIDTDGIPPADDVTGLNNVTRNDTPNQELHCLCDDLLALAPDRKERHIKVPGVFEGH